MTSININKEKFGQLMHKEKPVLVDFWAPWCGYCRRIGAAYEKISEEYSDILVAGKVNIDEEPQIAEAEKIEVIPTLVLYRNGKAIDSIVAPESKIMIENFINEALKKKKEDCCMNENHVYDMIIVGGGPGGYTSALYAARAGLDTIVIEKLSAGGQMSLTWQIDNYPGFENGIDGFSLAEKMQKQAEKFGAKSEYAEVFNMDLTGKLKRVETSSGIYIGKTVVIATGANPRELGLAKEKELIGHGVAYCASCDGMFYKDKIVVVVGGGNSAVSDAALLSRIAKKVIIVHRRDTLRATKIYHDQLMKTENIEFRWNSTVKELLYGERLTGVRLKDTVTGEENIIECDGLFVSIGRKPTTDFLDNQIELDNKGYIVAGENTETSIPGVYAVGDVRTKLLRQIVTAVADGAMAVHMAEEYVEK